MGVKSPLYCVIAVYLILYTSLFFGTLFAFISPFWFTAWIGLEVNAYAFIPIITLQNHPRATEAAVKYFFIQAFASTLLILATAHHSYIKGGWLITSIDNKVTLTLIILGLALKMGIAPFSYWLPEVIRGLNLKAILILATWQKIAPLSLLVWFANIITSQLLITLIIASSALAGWAGMNQTQLQKILTYSSTVHLGWVLVILNHHPSLSFLALVVYIFNSMTAFLVLKEPRSTKIFALTMIWSKNPILTTAIVLALFSLLGFPTTPNLINKTLIIQNLSEQQLTFPTIFFLTVVLFSLLFYTRWCYFAYTSLFPDSIDLKLIWRFKTKIAIKLLTIATITMFFSCHYPLSFEQHL